MKTIDMNDQRALKEFKKLGAAIKQ